MSKRTVSGITLTLLLIGMLTLTFNTQPVEANGTIYIRVDGSVDPDTAPISTVDNVTYIFTDNITTDVNGVVVERDNIVIDGSGYTLEKPGSLFVPPEINGIDLSNRNNVTIKNLEIKAFGTGIKLNYSANNRVSRNYITNNWWVGIHIYHASNNTISRNNVTDTEFYGLALESSSNFNSVSVNTVTSNGYGILLLSSNNTISRNNVIDSDRGITVEGSSNNIFGNYIANNGLGFRFCCHSSDNTIFDNNARALLDNTYQIYTQNSVNIWDFGYPSGGNFWSDYAVADSCSGPYQNETGGDGIGDTPYIIDQNNRDNYPLVEPWSPPSSIVGDLNNDGIVDIGDLLTAGKAFGSYPGHPRWNFTADMNNDSVVNIIDLVLIVKRFGRTV